MQSSLPVEEFETSVWATAVCSGALGRAAMEMAANLAVRERLDDEGESALTVPAVVRQEFARRVVTDDALRRLVHSMALDWVRVDVDDLVLRSEDAAREAIKALEEDGLESTAVATLANVPLERWIAYLEDLDPDLRAGLVGATAGEVVGPIRIDDGFHVIVVNGKMPPRIDDPEIRRRAEQTLVERAIRREVDERVVWHGDI